MRSEFLDIAKWWDKLTKPEIRDFCIGFSKQRKLRRDHTKRFLLSYLKIALEKKDWSEVGRVKSELDISLLAEIYEGFPKNLKQIFPHAFSNFDPQIAF